MSLDERFETILKAARAGAEWAIAALYRDVHPGLRRYLCAHEPQEGEDLASEVWIDVASGLARFEGDERAFRRWVFTIARRRLLDWRRRAARRRTEPASLERIEGAGSVGDVEAEAVATLTTAEAVARIAALPSGQAEVILLGVLGGLGTADVGRIVGKSEGAVRVLRHRALRRLAADLTRESVTQ
jgi:RNA polymerase sigma-70 factor (ECF subfamily)